MIQPERIELFNDGRTGGAYILYWMQSAVRSRYNHALEYAIEESNRSKKPLYVIFLIHPVYQGVDARINKFFTEGLSDVSHALMDRGISFSVFSGDPVNSIVKAAEDACLLVMDKGWTRNQRTWRSQVISEVSCKVAVIETNLIVPVTVASPKEEWSAGTLRPKLARVITKFLVPVTSNAVNYETASTDIFTDFKLSALNLEDNGQKGLYHPERLKGGETFAGLQLEWFLSGVIDSYEKSRNDPTANASSRLSAYIHFGHISPLEVALRVLEKKSQAGAAFLEQLIVRRELSHNFVCYNPYYDSFECLPGWAKKTLVRHSNDNREYTYCLEEFENAATHDRIWNAMQTEILRTGYLHGYLRMYWGKKILEWSRTPEEGYRIAVILNDRYQYDGRDPNGYAGVAWCFGKHDRPWKERDIFGTVRYMNESGLKRKFRVDGWCGRVEKAASETRS